MKGSGGNQKPQGGWMVPHIQCVCVCVCVCERERERERERENSVKPIRLSFLKTGM